MILAIALLLLAVISWIPAISARVRAIGLALLIFLGWWPI